MTTTLRYILFAAFLFICFLCIGNFIFSQRFNSEVKNSSLEIPAPIPKEEIVHHSAFTLSYNKLHKQANWVAYVLTEQETNSIYPREKDFKEDPLLKSQAATDLDYKKSGYDRGHLAPAADMEWSLQSVKESFYFSNISPQVPAFNRGIWEKLEEQVRVWAKEYDSVYVIAGPVLSTNLKAIGPNKVSVPSYFFKIILSYTTDGYHGIGFIMANKTSTAHYQQFAVSIDSVELMTRLDFFPSLPNAIESQIEGKVDTASWKWVEKNIKATKKSTGVKQATKKQCSAITTSGKRCVRKTSYLNGKCYQHGGK